MKRSRSLAFRLPALLLVVGLLAGACGDDDSADASGADDTELSGSVTIDGSSTVAPLSEAVAEEFNAEQPGVDVSVGTSGTGGGFKRFCNDDPGIRHERGYPGSGRLRRRRTGRCRDLQDKCRSVVVGSFDRWIDRNNIRQRE